MKRKEFEVKEDGRVYQLNNYTFIGSKPVKVIDIVSRSSKEDDYLELTFLRGSSPLEKGITHEQLLGTMIHDLQYKNREVPSRETSIVITKLQEALMWLEEREKDRIERKVLGTNDR